MYGRVCRLGGLIIFLIFSLISLGFSQSNDQITITTYYPSPNGQYNELRFFPHPTATVSCDAAHMGYVFYNSTPGVDGLMVCRYNSVSSTYEWAPGGGGYWSKSGNDIYNNNSGNVGIGTGATPPLAKLTVTNGGILAYGGTGATPVSGVGTRLMWIPAKSAFRAGYVDGAEWDDGNIGDSSFASGANTTASGWASVAMGYGSVALGDSAFAMGYNARAEANYSVAFGEGVFAQGDYAFAQGFSSQAIGGPSVAMGEEVAANAGDSFTFGSGVTVTGQHLINNTPSSLMVGFNSDIPTFFVGTSSGAGTTGKVGIGTVNPEFKLSLDDDGGIIAKGTFGSGATLLTTGCGPRLIWYPRKAAFRAGYASGDSCNNWDDANIGAYSIALGYGARASGMYATALSTGSTTGDASGLASTAIGNAATASGDYSFAAGQGTVAAAFCSTAIGNHAVVYPQGQGSIAMSTGPGDVTVTGIGSVAIGSSSGLFTFNNNIDHSLMVGFESDIPTLFVGGSSGPGTFGRVGIGTTNPLGMLDVNGPIYQRGVLLHADYVFDSGYSLESIEEHAKYMWQYKHLKAIPKAEYDESGKEIVEIGANNRGLLEEVEKAHVYIQQLNNRIKALEEKIKTSKE